MVPNLDLVHILIIKKADINRQDLCGISSLMFAFEYNLPKIAFELLNSRADVNLRNKNEEDRRLLFF